MLSYKFYSQQVSNILFLLKKEQYKLARSKYFLFKKFIILDLVSTILWLENLEKENKLTKDFRDFFIGNILIPFISDWNVIFTDAKIVKQKTSPVTKEAKIKQIIKNLGLNEKKELSLFNKWVGLITDLEYYLEAKDLSSKNLKNILLEAINIEKTSGNLGKSELIHFINEEVNREK